MILILGSVLAYQLHGVKILVGVGIGSQIVGFTMMLLSRTSISIKNRDLFDQMFEKHEKRTLPEIEGSPLMTRMAGGIWLILIGLSFELIGYFLV